VAARLLIFIVVTVGVLAAAFFGLGRRYTVRGAAMAPTVKSGDHVAVFRFSDWFYTPHRKDIVVFKSVPTPGCPGTRSVERVIGLPGETVSEHNGVVSIDGRPLKEPYVEPGHRDRRTAAWGRVPKGAYLVFGDNRTAPCNRPGPVLKKNIIGKVFLTFWPVERVSIG
jgi:signal peptidase I